ncbi:MAG: DUF2461 domain-containing protein [Saprospiraceae bacterium]|nr:DUF2461 domain-containing protein [Saprospiraceae bacterium]MCB0576370.1 DUF2461 domain-containing protein [Saprospiraceae bacterium]
MLNNDFLQFLYELSQNNNRDWFEKNKKRYESSVKKPFEETVGAVLERIRSFEPGFTATPKDCIFRIYRDTRFSADKTPYKTHVGAVLTSQGRKNMDQPGYYLHIEFGNLMLGGGAYFLDKEPLRKVRTAIMQDPGTFRDLVGSKDFVEKFAEIKGEKNKVMPPEFKEAVKSEPMLAHKQFYFMAEIDPENVLRPDFPDFAATYFKAGKPLNDFFRAAIG